MNMNQKPAAAPVKPPVQAPPAAKKMCEVAEVDGDLIVTFEITDPRTIQRLKGRAGTMDLGKYLWENILKRAIDTAVW